MRERLRLGACTVDFAALKARWPHATVDLTSSEVKLLAYMAARPGQTLSRRQLLSEVWGYHDSVRSRTADNTMARLRSKVEEEPGEPRWLVTEFGKGYRFVPPEPVEGADTRCFVGREPIMAELERHVGNRVVTLVGPSGIGKTRIAHALLADATGWFVDLRGVTRLDEAVGAVARAVGREGSANLTLDGLADTFRRNGGVLVVDDASECPEVAATLTNTLSQVVPVRLTAHAPLGLDDEHVIVVPSLQPEHASELLQQLVPPGAGLEGSQTLLQQLGGMPLAIELAAARLGTVSAQTLADELGRTRASLSADRGALRHRSVDAAIASMWERLEAPLQAALGALVAAPGAVPEFLALLLLESVCQSPVVALHDLASRALVHVRHRGAERWVEILPLVRAWVSEQVSPTSALRHVAKRLVSELDMHPENGRVCGTPEATLKARDALATLVCAARKLRGHEPELVDALVAVVLTTAIRFRSPREGLALAEELAAAVTDPSRRALVLRTRLDLLRRLGRHDEVLATDLGQLTGVSRSVVETTMAITAFDKGDVDGALVLTSSALKHAGIDRYARAIARVNEAQVRLRQGAVDAAHRAISEAAEVLWSIPMQRAIVGYVLARVLTAQKRYSEALAAASEAADSAHAMGLVTVEMCTLSAQARALHDSGRFEEAAAHHRRAAQLARDNGNRLTAVASAANRALCLIELGRPREARDVLVRTLRPPTFESVATDCARAVLARALYLLGSTDEADGVLGACEARLLAKGDPGQLVAQAQSARA